MALYFSNKGQPRGTAQARKCQSRSFKLSLLQKTGAFTNTGVDYQGILRAILSNALGRLWKVVAPLRNRWRILFSIRSSVWRKIKEVRLSQKIEQK